MTSVSRESGTIIERNLVIERLREQERQRRGLRLQRDTIAPLQAEGAQFDVMRQRLARREAIYERLSQDTMPSVAAVILLPFLDPEHPHVDPFSIILRRELAQKAFQSDAQTSIQTALNRLGQHLPAAELYAKSHGVLLGRKAEDGTKRIGYYLALNEEIKSGKREPEALEAHTQEEEEAPQDLASQEPLRFRVGVRRVYFGSPLRPRVRGGNFIESGLDGRPVWVGAKDAPRTKEPPKETRLVRILNGKISEMPKAPPVPEEAEVKKTLDIDELDALLFPKPVMPEPEPDLEADGEPDPLSIEPSPEELEELRAETEEQGKQTVSSGIAADDHKHRFKIAEPNGPTSPGVCSCGVSKVFRNSAPEYTIRR